MSCDLSTTHQNSCWHVSATANGDHEVRLEFIENPRRRSLAQFVDLPSRTDQSVELVAGYRGLLTSLYVT